MTDVMVSDQDLLAAMAQRDQQALAALYERYGTAVYSIAMRVLDNTIHAEEAAQDTFLKVWNKPDAWNHTLGAFSSWLLTIARYTAIDRLRKERPHHPLVELHETHAAHVDLREDEHGFRALLAELPHEQAHVIDLAFYHGLTHQQLADQMQLPLGTIKTRLRLGLQKLRVMWMERQLP